MRARVNIRPLSVAALAVISCGPSREVSHQNVSARETSGTKRPEATPTISLGRFAFVDSSGTQLLALGPLADPSKILGAVCSRGLVLPVRYDRRQAQQPGDNG